MRSSAAAAVKLRFSATKISPVTNCGCNGVAKRLPNLADLELTKRFAIPAG
jgi:hypothetical protein